MGSVRQSLRSRLGALRNRWERRRTLARTSHLEGVTPDDAEVDLPNLDLSTRQQGKLKAMAEILGCSENDAARLIYDRAFAGLPNRPLRFYLLPDLKVKTCERIGDDLVRIELEGGRVFLGQRSELKECLLYNVFRRRLPEIVTGDAYKLAMDIQRRYFETALNTQYFGEGGTYVEGGCFTGMKAIRWADLASKPTRILAVEIGETNFDILQANIKANNVEGTIVPVHAGLWHESGQGTQKHSFTTRRFLEATDRWEEHMRYEEPVRLLTLDDLLDEHQVDVADYVNIQVNGAELHVLDGWKRNVDRVKVISIAAYYSQDGRKNADVVQERLEALGCKILQRTTNGRISAVTPRFRDEVAARSRKGARGTA